MAELLKLRDQFRDAEAKLIAERRRLYRVGAVVQSTSDPHHWGVIAHDGGCPPDKIPVTFENGNTWWKEFDQFAPVHDMKSLSKWVRRMVLRIRIGRKVVFAP